MADSTPKKSIDASADNDTYLKSTTYEQLVEHLFISEVLQEALYRYSKTVEVLHGEVDASGYDLVLDCNGYIRHLQLKTSKPDKKGSQPVNVALAEKPSGCVVWVLRHEDRKTCRTTLSYRFFGGDPGKPLPSLQRFSVATRATPNKEGIKPVRQAIRLVPKSQFDLLPDTTTLVKRLFGLPNQTDGKSKAREAKDV